MTVKLGPDIGEDELTEAELAQLEAGLERPIASHMRPAAATGSKDTKNAASDFNFRNMMRPGTAHYDVKSADVELGGSRKEKWQMSRDDKHFLPAPLSQCPEGEEIFDFLRSPTTDPRQIQQRQEFIQIFRDSDALPDILKVKNECYSFLRGISKLTSPIYDDHEQSSNPISAFQRGHKTGEEAVTEGMKQIEKGRAALPQLIARLESFHHPYLDKMIPPLKKFAESLKIITIDYLKTGGPFEILSFLGKTGNSFKQAVMPVGMMMEFANIVKRDSYGKATFNPSEPLEFRGGWHFARSKEAVKAGNYREKDVPAQVLNDSPKEHPLTVYTGSNMSGKSFELKKAFYIQLLAQSFGYVPAAEGNFALYDSFHYLDRAATDPSRDLSAFGSEIIDCKRAITQFGGKPFIILDEAFSTTSPEDQYRLMTALDLYLRQRGARVFLASHNERFIQRYSNDQNVGLNHLRVTVSENGEVQYHHKLASGPADSLALDVARNLGLPEAVLARAEAYLRGEFPHIDCIKKPTYRKLTRYSAAERETLKKDPEKSRAVFRSLFPTTFNSHENRGWQFSGMDEKKKGPRTILKRFSDDTDLTQTRFALSAHEEGGWTRETSIYVTDFLVNVLEMTPEEALERQKLFANLVSEESRLEEMELLRANFMTTVQYISGILSNASDLTSFNLKLSPDTDYRSSFDFENRHLILTYLRFNKELLGDEFTMHDELEHLIEVLDLEKNMDEADMLRDLDEIVRLEDQVYSAEISDPNVIAAFEFFMQKYAGEYPLVIPTAPYTRGSVEHFYMWLTNKKHRYYHNPDFRKRDPIEENLKALRPFADTDIVRLANRKTEPEDGSDPRLLSHPDDIKLVIAEFVPLYGEDEPDRWGGTICIARLEALKERILRLHRTHPRHDNLSQPHAENYMRLRAFSEGMKSSQHYLQTGKIGENTYSPSQLERYLYSLMRKLHEKAKTLPGRSLFDERTNFEALKPQIQELLDFHLKALSRSRKEANERDRSDWFYLGFQLLMHDKNAVSEYFTALREYDSVHIQQMANQIENMAKKVFGPEKRRSPFDEPKDPSRLKMYLQSGPELFAEIKRRHMDGLGEMKADLEALELEEKAFKPLKEGIFSGETYGNEDLADSIAAALKDPSKWNSRDDRRIALSFINWVYKKEEDNSDDEDNDLGDKTSRLHGYRNRIFQDNHKDRPSAIMADFMRDEKAIVDPKLEEFHRTIEMRTELEAKALAFCKKYSISFKPVDGRVYELKAIHGGKFDCLRSVLHHSINVNASKIGEKPYMPGLDSGDIYAYTEMAITPFKIAEMIRGQGQVPVEFNETGKIAFTQAWNVLKPKTLQVTNDVTFNPAEQMKVINGANMSGKTFWLKEATFAMLWGMATGHAPAEFATMPLVDRVVYLDRVLVKGDSALSAFGNEITFWKAFLELIERDEGAVTVSMLDEIFSTTSPKYQAALAAAILTHTASHGGLSAVALHHHDFIDRLLAAHPEAALPYFFSGHPEVDPEKGVTLKADYHMTRGHVSSQAVEVARGLGFPEEILKIAELIK